jgi:hypothetical protein
MLIGINVGTSHKGQDEVSRFRTEYAGCLGTTIQPKNCSLDIGFVGRLGSGVFLEGMLMDIFANRRCMPDSDLRPHFPVMEVVGVLAIIPVGVSFVWWVLSNIFAS